MTAFYNEIEPYAAEWMRNLVKAGHINSGAVEERSIRELTGADVKEATQAHFFAGVGCWSYALRLAGWPDDLSVWTGSCPCQPFSAAGKRGGFADDRHLWPEWFRLIKECRPPVIFGEQVASPDGLKWLDTVQTDLEGEGYAFAAADLCAAGVGAPHIRQRLYFVAYSTNERCLGIDALLRSKDRGGRTPSLFETTRSGKISELGDAYYKGSQGRFIGRVSADQWVAGAPSVVDELAHTERNEFGQVSENAGRREKGSESEGMEQRFVHSSFWSNAAWLPCRDGKTRPIEPSTFPLAHGATSRVGRLRAYGNAIVPQVAATFIKAAMMSIFDR